MPQILLAHQDVFLVTRSIVFAEIKKWRRTADLFGDELQLTPDSILGEGALQATAAELAGIAAPAGGFFGLEPEAISDLARLPSLGQWASFILERAGPRPRRITFYTSGSTGTPKPIVRDYFDIEQDALHLAEMLRGSQRLLGLVPPHHIYGFIYTILIPKVLQVPLADLRFLRPAAILASVQPGDTLIGFPYLWKQIADTKGRFPPTALGVTSTGPCPPEIIHILRRLGLQAMIEVYGSSESGAMGYRTSPEAPLTLMATWRHIGNGRFVRAREDGGESEPYVFQDVLEWRDETHFVVRQRLDNAVQVAGINVYPDRVREALLAHPAVADCAVRLMRPEEGDRLKAFVVLKADQTPGPAMLDALRVHLAGLLYRVEQPAAIRFGPELPRNAMGKLADWTIDSGRVGMTLEEALARLQADQATAAPPLPGQPVTVGELRPEDGWGVARLFHAIHGPHFPFPTYYIPERLLDENRLGLVYSAVARTPAGEVVGYGSLFRSSAPYHGVYEIGAHQVHPAYHGARVDLALQTYLRESLIPAHPVEVFFSEAPCHQVVTQKFAAMSGLRETALEIGLMPAAAYGPPGDAGDAGDRVSNLLLFGRVDDRQRRLHVPDVYADALNYLLEGLDLDRLVLPADEQPPASLTTRTASEQFDFAQVARLHVLTLGPDFPRVLGGFEAQARQAGARVLQVFINLGQAWCGEGVSTLRAQGYFLGGLLPRWFDDDGLLLQRVLDLPDPDQIQLYSQRAHRLLDLIRRDIESNPACTALPVQPLVAPPATNLPFRAADLDAVTLAGEGLTVAEVVAAARHGREVRLTRDPATLARVEASAAFIEWAVRTGEPIYGVNTGFGGMANVAIAAADLLPLQNNLLRFLNAGAGDYLPTEDVRAAMLLRANSHLRGASGVRRELIDRLLLFLNRGVTPRVRDLGSIGASGDLVPLASITGALIGADPCFQVEMDGEILDSLSALDRLGLSPLTLGPKEGLGMVNGTSVMTGIAANCLYDARRLTALALACHALAIQALRGSNQSFHPFIQRLKPHPGQILAAELMLDLLHGSAMSRNELDGHHDLLEGQPAQDRYSLRCLPQFVGPLLDGLRQARTAIETEMNSANDNPLIDGEHCLSLHSGNFLGEYVAVWMDHLRYYLGLMAKHLDAQIALLVAPEFSGGLPPSLVGNPGRQVNMGLKGLQIAANAIMPLLSYYGAPIADRFPTHAEQFNQNINSQGFNAANLARKAVKALESYLAMALIFGVQAVALRAARMGGSHDPRPLLSPATGQLYEAVLGALGQTPRSDRPLIWNDDEQSLEHLVETLRNEIASDGRTVAAVSAVLLKLG